MKHHAPFGSTDPDASYVDRDTPGAVRGSSVPGAAIEDPQRELVDVILAVGLTPDDVNQLARAIQSSKLNFVAAAGTANAITGDFSPALPTADYRSGLLLNLLVASANTGAATFNGKAIVNTNGGALIGGELVAGNIASMIYDGVRFRLVGTSRGLLLNTQVFTASGTYTPTPGTQYIEVEVQGAGGAGGGAPATIAGQSSAAGFGGSGAYAKKLVTSSFEGVPVTVRVGGAGVNGASGGNGGTSSFGTHVSAMGGGGATIAGPSAATSIFAAGGTGGVAGTSGDMNLPGLAGGGTQIASSQGIPGVLSPGMFLGGFGAGGEGSASSPNTPAKTGGSGKSGIVIVKEYA